MCININIKTVSKHKNRHASQIKITFRDLSMQRESNCEVTYEE